MLYFAESEDGELIKIGYTRRDVDMRLKEISKRERQRFYCVSRFSGSYRLEREIHKRLSVYRYLDQEIYLNDGKLADLVWQLRRANGTGLKRLVILAAFFMPHLTPAKMRDWLNDVGLTHNYSRQSIATTRYLLCA